MRKVLICCGGVLLAFVVLFLNDKEQIELQPNMEKTSIYSHDPSMAHPMVREVYFLIIGKRPHGSVFLKSRIEKKL